MSAFNVGDKVAIKPIAIPLCWKDRADTIGRTGGVIVEIEAHNLLDVPTLYEVEVGVSSFPFEADELEPWPTTRAAAA